MNNLNVGVLVSSVLATAGLGVYVYMNNNNNNNNNIITEYLHNEEDVNDEENSNENEIKSTKKSITVKSKRRAHKTNGTRRKRYY
jgi:hypothetical protein